MDKEILIVRTKTGHQYAKFIARKIESLGAKCCGIVYREDLDDFLKKHGCSPEKTLLHYRTAGPLVTPKAYQLEKKGYRLINAARVLDLTADKFKSYEWASQHGVSLPFTKKGARNEIKKYSKKSAVQRFVLKPINSVERGAFCFRSSINDPKIDQKLSQIPGEKIILQEFVEYLRIYRVIVIGNKTLDQAVLYDEPNSNRWKVSVCLNPEMKLAKNPNQKLLSYAKKLANIFESEIAFIDIFETQNNYVLSEINTACNLILHEQKSGYSISEDIAKYLVSELSHVT